MTISYGGLTMTTHNQLDIKYRKAGAAAPIYVGRWRCLLNPPLFDLVFSTTGQIVREQQCSKIVGQREQGVSMVAFETLNRVLLLSNWQKLINKNARLFIMTYRCLRKVLKMLIQRFSQKLKSIFTNTHTFCSQTKKSDHQSDHNGL